MISHNNTPFHLKDTCYTPSRKERITPMVLDYARTIQADVGRYAMSEDPWPTTPRPSFIMLLVSSPEHSKQDHSECNHPRRHDPATTLTFFQHQDAEDRSEDGPDLPHGRHLCH